MKKIVSLILSLCIMSTMLVGITLPAAAATSGYYTYSVSSGKATITDCSASISGNVTIPSTLGGYPVTSIGGFAFYNCNRLTSVTIPDSVTDIQISAFRNCSNLTSITIGSGVTSIGNRVFYDCSSLTSITIPDSVTSIGDSAFYNCSSLTSITIPDSVTSIGSAAFSGCKSLTSINVSEDNSNYCSDDGVVFNKNKTSIICYPYGKNDEYIIPDSVTSIGPYAFSSCSLTSITIPDSVTSIGSAAFYYCDSLTSITIPDSVTSIGSSTFSFCSSLTSITIDNGVTSIGNAAFYGCYRLTSITIPNSVTSIGDSAFYNCSSLNEVYYHGTADEWTKIEISSNNEKLTEATRYYHKYDNCCDDSCDFCGETRVPPHIYSNDCDVNCNTCGYTRTVGHFYEWIIDKEAICVNEGEKHEECSLCHIKRNENTIIAAPSSAHTYDHNSDADCNVCHAIRDVAEIPTLLEKTSTSVTLKPTNGYEYSKDGVNWQNSNVFSNLEANKEYRFYQRKAKTQTTPAGLCSAVLVVVTLKHTPIPAPAPMLVEATQTSVKLVKITAYEYSKDGVNWQSSSIFENLTPGTEYTFYQRLAETSDTYAGSSSAGLNVKTSAKVACSITPAKPIVANYTISKVVLVEREGYEYSIDGVNWTSEATFKDLKANTKYTFYQRIAETATELASEKSAGVSVTTDALNPTAASSLNLILLKEYIKLNGSLDSSGRYSVSMTSSTSDQTTSLIVKDDKLYITFSHSSGNTQVGKAWTMEFQITDESKYLVIDYWCRYWAKVVYSKNDDVSETVVIDRSTHTKESTYSLEGEGKMLVSNEAFSSDFNEIFDVTLDGWDSWIYNRLGFGLRGLGFVSYDGYGKATCDWITGYHTGDDEIRNKREPLCTVDGYTGYIYCTDCHQLKTTGSVIKSVGHHTYTNNCDETCNVCGEDRIIEHTYSNNCDEKCDVCDAKREVNHLYDNECDVECNDCGFNRKVPHIFDGRNDLICNNCGYERPPYTLGDLDENETVTDADAVRLLMHTFFPEDYPVNQDCDFNSDGNVTDADAVYLLMYTFFPETYPIN